MLWYQNSFLLDPTDRRSMHSRDDRYNLHIRNFQTSDFGNYSCVADNALGRTKKYIEVSGRPGPADFISPALSGALDHYNLTWTIESIPEITDVKLLYRRLLVSLCIPVSIFIAFKIRFYAANILGSKKLLYSKCF